MFLAIVGMVIVMCLGFLAGVFALAKGFDTINKEGE